MQSGAVERISLHPEMLTSNMPFTNSIQASNKPAVLDLQIYSFGVGIGFRTGFRLLTLDS